MFTEKNILNLLCFDRDANALFEERGLIKNKKIEEITDFYFVSSKNNKIHYFSTGEKHLKRTNKFFFLRSFDENFDLLAEIKLDKEPKGHDINEENLFILTKNEKCSTLSM